MTLLPPKRAVKRVEYVFEADSAHAPQWRRTSPQQTRLCANTQIYVRHFPILLD